MAFAADGCKGVGVPLFPRFSALPWWLLELLRLKAFPWGKVPPKEADEGEGIEAYPTYSKVLFHKLQMIAFPTELACGSSMAFPSSVIAMPREDRTSKVHFC